MRTTLNTLKIDNEGTLVPVKVTVSVSPGIGVHVVNMKDSGVKEMLLRTITAIQDAGYRIPGKKIVISFSEEITTLFSLSDAAVAIALLIATEQIKPVLKYDIINISGELRTDKASSEIRYHKHIRRTQAGRITEETIVHLPTIQHMY